MSNQYGAHPSHCCVHHGCKYGDKECPVYDGTVVQEYACQDCPEQIPTSSMTKEAYLKAASKYLPYLKSNPPKLDMVDVVKNIAALLYQYESWSPISHETRYQLQQITKNGQVSFKK